MFRGRWAATVSPLPGLTVGMAKVLKYTAIMALVAGIIANLPDIKRYIKIRMM
jgi:hypothetical protein